MRTLLQYLLGIHYDRVKGELPTSRKFIFLSSYPVFSSSIFKTPYAVILLFSVALLLVNNVHAAPGEVSFVNGHENANSYFTYSEESGTHELQVSRSGGSDGAATVDLRTLGTGFGVDYTFSPLELNWADGEGDTKTVSLVILDDDSYEGEEPYSLELIFPEGVTIGAKRFINFLIDDSGDANSGVFSITSIPTSVNEADESFQVTVTRTDGSEGAVTATLLHNRNSDDTAQMDVDYSLTTSTLSWADGELGSKVVTVLLDDDDEAEGDEIFSLYIDVPAGQLGSIYQGDITIVDNDPITQGFNLLTMSVGSDIVDEDVGSYQIAVSRTDGQFGLGTSVEVVSADGTAEEGADYTFSPSMLDWDAGDTDDQFVTVTILDDVIDEGDETVKIKLKPHEVYILGAEPSIAQPGFTVVTIKDNDETGTLNMSAALNRVLEDVGTYEIIVSRTGGSNGAVSADISIGTGSNATEGSGADFTYSPDNLSWPDGDTADRTITVTVIDDAEIENDETIILELSNATGADIGVSGSASVIIEDNDGTGTLNMGVLSSTVSEDSGTYEIIVSRTGGSSGAVSADISIGTGSNATEGSGADFTYSPDNLSWPDGDIADRTITVTVIDDAEIENDETVILELSNVTGADIGNSASVIIEDNDGTGTLNMGVLSSTVSEDVGTYEIIVSRTGGSNGAVSADIIIGNGSAGEGGSADYIYSPAQLSWSDGDDADKVVTVTVRDDDDSENSETVMLQLANVSGATVGTSNDTTVTIEDNDPILEPGTLTIGAGLTNAGEDIGSFEVLISRNGGSVGAASVDVAVGNGTAQEGADADFTYSPSQLSWSDGDDADKVVIVTVIDDSDIEDDETVVLQLSNALGADIGSPISLIITLEDNDDDSESPVDPVVEAVVDLADTPQQAAVAKSVATSCQAIDGSGSSAYKNDCEKLLAAAQSDDPETLEQAAVLLKEITVDDASIAVKISESGITSQKANLTSRLNALRNGARGIDLSGLSVNVFGQSLSTKHLPRDLAVSERQSGGSAGTEEPSLFGKQVGVFVSGKISLGDRDASGNEEGFEFKARDITVGVDYRLTDQTVVGGAIGYTHTDTDIASNGGAIDAGSVSLSLYGTSYQKEQFFLEGIFTLGKNDFDQSRRINYQLVGEDEANQVASSDYNGDQISLAIGGGRHFLYSGVSITATGRVEYVDTTIDSYEESMSNPGAEGSGWGVSMDKQSMDSLTFSLGVDMTYALSRSWGVLSPQLSAEWVHEFQDDSRLISASFVGDTTNEKFFLPTDSADTDYFNLRLGVTGQFSNGGSAYIYYQKLLGYDDLDIDTIGLGVRWMF